MNTTLLFTFIGISIVTWLIQIVHYLVFMRTPKGESEDSIEGFLPPVSVIICARNEAENLKNFLPRVLEQDYPKFQVVVVNDCSTDDTEIVLAQMKRQYDHLYFTSIPVDKKFFHGKKLALSIGVKAAQYDHLILTDADCYPASGNWLKNMTTKFSSKKELVIGYGKYEKRKGLLNLFVRYETFWNAVQYVGFVIAGKPFMGVGRNLAYKKSLFQGSNVFRSYLNVASGDDDLFINQMGNRTNTAVCVHPEGQTISVPVTTFFSWWNQKSRHLTTSVFYPWTIKFWLGLEVLSRQIFWVLTLCSYFFPTFVRYSLLLFLTRLLLQYVVLGRASKRMGEKHLFWATILFDFITPLLLGALWVSNLMRTKNNKWK